MGKIIVPHHYLHNTDTQRTMQFSPAAFCLDGGIRLEGARLDALLKLAGGV
ncbi:MAG: hypothetical protein ACE5FI_00855 [Anaerolineales bacterium]